MHREVELAFFQASALIIPTLFIAFAVSSRLMRAQTGGSTKIWFLAEHRLKDILIAATMLLAFGVSEMISLASLATKHTSHSAMYIVALSASLMIWLICYNSLAPMLADLKAEKLAIGLATGGWSVLMIAFLVTFFVYGGSIG